jgi:hypothetical protein
MARSEGDVEQERPQRMQLRRTKGWRMPPATVKVDRATIFGNPFSVEQHGRRGSVRMYRLWLEGKFPDRVFLEWAMSMLYAKRSMIMEALSTLEGKNLACWCPLPKLGEPDMCHAAVLLDIVQAKRRQTSSGG